MPSSNRGISFQGARFRYRYLTIDSDNTAAFYVQRYWSALVVAPCDATGTPLGDGTGVIPSIGSVIGDCPFGIRILWRGLDFCSAADANTSTKLLSNDWGRYNPVEHVKSKAFLKEGTGLFWVTELVSGVLGIQASTLDLTMSLALRNVV